MIFTGPPLHAPPIASVVHESGGDCTVEELVRTLRARKARLHYCIDQDGKRTQLMDLGQRGAHAGHKLIPSGHSWNACSIGIDLLGPYYPDRRPSWWPNTSTISNSSWIHKRRGKPRLYQVPPLAQLESLYKLTEDLPGAGVLPDLRDGALRMRAYKPGPEWWARPGIVAHGLRSGHADGRFPLLYCVLRSGMGSAEAYERAVELGRGAAGSSVRV